MLDTIEYKEYNEINNCEAIILKPESSRSRLLVEEARRGLGVLMAASALVVVSSADRTSTAEAKIPAAPTGHHTAHKGHSTRHSREVFEGRFSFQDGIARAFLPKPVSLPAPTVPQETPSVVMPNVSTLPEEDAICAKGYDQSLEDSSKCIPIAPQSSQP